ncbi:hypothetical protein E7Z53_08000 [Kocuria salina]|uniref:hypothetical protein n=1 Tax=Kocuria salina TaxID=1929416 RepID=UPI001593E6A1|nr:hypothetical protein [Kocuria salina]NVC23385.1 hypothetical protein [Kocuria salina]
MNRPQLMGNGARRDTPAGPRDFSRSHSAPAGVVAATEAYAGRLISIGTSDGPGLVVLTGAETYSDAVVLAFRYRDGRTSTRRLDPATTVLIHRTR